MTEELMIKFLIPSNVAKKQMYFVAGLKLELRPCMKIEVTFYLRGKVRYFQNFPHSIKNLKPDALEN